MSEARFPGCVRCEAIRHGSAEYDATVALRDEVLRKPLGLRLTEEQLRAESADHHVACFLDGRIIACLVLTPESGRVARMRQVAVAAEHRRQGIGTDLVRYAERFAAAHGYTEVTAHAREPAVPFYKRLGYAIVGERFVEVGIPHFTVRKELVPA